jgi:hypothetical protein
MRPHNFLLLLFFSSLGCLAIVDALQHDSTRGLPPLEFRYRASPSGVLEDGYDLLFTNTENKHMLYEITVKNVTLRTERKFPLRMAPKHSIVIKGPDGSLFPADIKGRTENNPLSEIKVGRFETDDVLFIKNQHYRTVFYALSALPEEAN